MGRGSSEQIATNAKRKRVLSDLQPSAHPWHNLDRLATDRDVGTLVALGENQTVGTGAENVGSSYPVIGSPLQITDLSYAGRWTIEVRRTPGESMRNPGHGWSPHSGISERDWNIYFGWINWLSNSKLTQKRFASLEAAQTALSGTLDRAGPVFSKTGLLQG